MSDIQVLTSKVQQLGSSASLWNRLALWAVAATAIVAALYFVFSLVASRKNTALQIAQAEPDHAKDSQLAGDLKDKDVAISAADQKAASAKLETARLTKEAEQAKTERAEADKQIAIAKADAARAKEGIANAEAVSAKAGVEVARLQVVVANAEKRRLEAERALLEVQERIKPRRLTAKQSADFVKILKSLPNGTIDVGWTSGGADEAFTFAVQILSLFKEAHWTVRNEASINNHLDISVVGIGVLVRGAASTDPSKRRLRGASNLLQPWQRYRLRLRLSEWTCSS